MGHEPARPVAVGRETIWGKLDGARRGARGEAVDGARLRLGGSPGGMPGLEEIGILQRRGCDQRAVNRVESKTLLSRV